MTTLDRVNRVVMEVNGTSTAAPPEPNAVLYYDAMTTNADAHRAAGGYGLDSLDGVEIVMMLEEEFGVDIPDAVASGDEFQTTGGMAAWIDRQKGEG